MPVREHRIALPSRYRVVRHIANGGMASVWAAEDKLLERLVAVKVLSPAYAEDDRANRRFLREARAGARLSECRHVVTVYDIGEHEDRPFMVMEHFAGGTVADRLRSGREISRALGLRWLREAAEALDCAHRHDVVHRDVKPANLLLDEGGRLAVGDFGIATVATEASVTQTGQVLGTAAYISPEQARGEPATAASDRYALAVVAFELLTGRRPFEADHPAAQARAHVEASVPSASAAGAGLPPTVDGVLRAGMAKDPTRRPPTAWELLDRLDEAIDDDVSRSEAPTAVTTVEARGATGPRELPTARGATGPRERPTARGALAPREPAASRGQAAPLRLRPTARASRRRWPGLAALAALALVAGAAIAIAAGTGGGGGGAASSSPTTQAQSRQAPVAAPQGQSPPKTKTKTKDKAQPKQKAKGVAPRTTPQTGTNDPVALNNQGFSLVQQGQAPQAVASLQRSVDAFRSQGRKGEVDYAYALYNLGTALRMSGRPADAIPYLEERLTISDYKRGVVKKELQTARQQAGQD
jgi:eukaryotic-like serine/threonine-protein kinase